MWVAIIDSLCRFMVLYDFICSSFGMGTATLFYGGWPVVDWEKL